MMNRPNVQQAIEDRLIESLREQIHGRPIGASLSIEEIAKRMASQIPHERDQNRLAQKAGPFYDGKGVADWLGISRQAIHKRRGVHKILGCRTSNGKIIYPVWQFRNTGELLPGLSVVLKTLAQGIDDPWTWALWLRGTVEGELGAKTVDEWLRDGGDVEAVLRLARNDAVRWAA